jgi:dimethylamine/trimethylamine dehydrogenase
MQAQVAQPSACGCARGERCADPEHPSVDSLALARDSRHDVLFEPIRVGPKTMRNRFFAVPHCTGYGVEKPWTQARFRATKAEGGWAAVCTEYCSVGLDADEMPAVSARLWDEDDVRSLALMCEEVHEHGALAGVELHHSGAHGPQSETRWPAVAPSQLASDLDPLIVPKAMEREDIRRVQSDWAAAAQLARAAGFDIVYVYGGHSYLPMQFLSPFYNRRTDEYGGTFANRARFWLETLEAVREAVGDDCAIAARISVDALGPAGVELQEGIAFVGLADGLVDLWDVNVGSITEWSKDSGVSRFFPEGYQLEWTGKVRRATTKPIVGVGRLTNPDRMAEIVRSGVWDLVGAARASIADPFLPRKIEEGRYGEIRECIGSNVCVAKGELGRHLGCTQNATAGEEFRRRWHPERFDSAANADRDVLVFGAGPAGMECAIVLGKRGLRRVHLVEAETELGGAMRWIPRLPGLGEWARVVNWRVVQLARLENVEVITGSRLDAQAALDYGAELIIVATGAHWATDGISAQTHTPIAGADAAAAADVLTPEQIMLDGKVPPGERVIVYDGEGYFVAAGVAEKLAVDGFAVELVTPFAEIAPFCDETLEGQLLRRHLHQKGIALRAGLTIQSFQDGLAIAETEFGQQVQLTADALVLVTQRVSNEQLYLELRQAKHAWAPNGVEAVYRIGDCVAPRILADVIFDGHRLAREIDAENPAIPQPHRRERPLPAHDSVGRAASSLSPQ